jgi:Ca-activated chloride channel family protein
MMVAAVTIALAVRAHKQAPNVDSTAVDWGRRCAISAVIVVMLLGPATTVQSTTRAVSATDVVIAVDITGSMAVQDAKYPDSGGSAVTRITAARYAVDTIVNLYPDSSFAALSFGGSTTLGLPLTPDTYAVESWVDNLQTEPTGISSGSNPSSPLDGLTTVLSDMRKQHANDTIVLYYISDDGGQVPQLRTGLRAGDALPDGTTWVPDPDTGQPAVSKRDSQTMSQIADELSGTYQAIDANTPVSYPHSGASAGDYRMVQIDKPTTTTNAIVWPFAFVLAALLIWEAIAHARTSRRLL